MHRLELQHEAAQFERSHPLFMAQVTVVVLSTVCPAGVNDLFFSCGIEPPAENGYGVSMAVFVQGRIGYRAHELAG